MIAVLKNIKFISYRNILRNMELSTATLALDEISIISLAPLRGHLGIKGSEFASEVCSGVNIGRCRPYLHG